MSIEDEIRSIAEGMIKKLSHVKLFDKSNKERFQDILEELEENKEIFSFIPKPNKKFKDFAVIIENKGKHDMVGVAILRKEEEIREYMKKQEQARIRVSRYRKFIKRFVLAVNPEMTDNHLKKQWANALKQYQES